VLSIRQDDMRTLSVIFDEPPSMLAQRFVAWGVLNSSKATASDDL
jgi:hypothetical protein